MGTKKFDRSLYFNITQLKARGWTQGSILKFLGQPHVITKNPMYNSAAPQKLYLVSEVINIEQIPEYRAWLSSSIKTRNKLSESIKKVNKEKKKQLINYISHLNIKLPKLPQNQLLDKAIAHYNHLWYSRGKIKTADKKSDKNFLNRICVNYLRHCCCEYEKILINMFGKIGKEEGYQILKEKINKKIFKLYPYLNSVENNLNK